MAPKKAKAKGTRKVKDLQPRKGTAAEVKGGRGIPLPKVPKPTFPHR